MDLSAEELWRTYVMLTDLEAVFRSLKSELGLRPIYHSTGRRGRRPSVHHGAGLPTGAGDPEASARGRAALKLDDAPEDPSAPGAHDQRLRSPERLHAPCPHDLLIRMLTNGKSTKHLASIRCLFPMHKTTF